MANITAARAELERVEAFLRTRYHYPHPIFERLAAALEHLEGEVPAPEPTPEPETVSIPSAQVSDQVEVTDSATNPSTTTAATDLGAEPEGVEPEPPPRQRARKRG